MDQEHVRPVCGLKLNATCSIQYHRLDRHAQASRINLRVSRSGRALLTLFRILYLYT